MNDEEPLAHLVAVGKAHGDDDLPLERHQHPLLRAQRQSAKQTARLDGHSRQHTWHCPNVWEYTLIGYMIQKFIRERGEQMIALGQDGELEIPVDADRSESFAREGIFSFQYKGRLYLYRCNWQNDTHTVVGHESVEQLLADLQPEIRQGHPYRGKFLEITGPGSSPQVAEIRAVPQVDYHQLILPAEMKSDLHDNTVFHLKHVAGNNGIILHGPPGTGKSLACQAVAAEAVREGFTVGYVVGRVDFQALDVFVRRYLAPMVLILEDIDSFAEDRRNGRPSYFADFLQFLSGLCSRHDKIVVIATTNHLDLLDAAVARRPFRFNRRYNFPLPPPALVDSLLDHYFGAGTLDNARKSLCHQREFTGAHVGEIRRTAELLALKHRTDVSSQFEEAVEIVSGQFNSTSSLSRGFG